MSISSQFFPFTQYEAYYSRPQLRDAHTDFTSQWASGAVCSSGRVETVFRKEAALHLPTWTSNALACIHAWRQRPKYHRSRFVPALRTARPITHHVRGLSLQGTRRQHFLSVLYWERLSSPQFFAGAEAVLQGSTLRIVWSGQGFRFRKPLPKAFSSFSACSQHAVSMKLLKTRVLSLPRSGRTTAQRITFVRGLNLSFYNSITTGR